MDNHDTIYVMAEEIAGSLSEPKKTVVSFSIVRLTVLFAEILKLMFGSILQIRLIKPAKPHL